MSERIEASSRPLNPAAADCAAVLVTYHPEMAVLKAVLAATLPQVDRVIVVDNGSGESLEESLLEFTATKRVVLRRLGRNFGVAYAHNRGLEEVVASGYRWALILDQDSIPAPDMVERLVRGSLAAAAAGVRVSAAGPRYVDPRNGHEQIFVGLGGWRFREIRFTGKGPDDTVRVDWLISSGMLISRSVLQDVGLMREDLFIDEVDTEWCLRARHTGYQCICATGAVMAHTLGNDTIRVWFKGIRHVPIHSPIRLYYMMRNGLLLARMSHVPLTWWVPNLKRLAAQFVVFATMVPPRTRNLAMMARGLLDGLRGASGPFGNADRP